MKDLRISLVQGATRWHDPEGNRDYYGDLIAPLGGATDLVILPETFTSGFSNDVIDQAETMDGETVAWIRTQAELLGAAVTGSVQLRTADGAGSSQVFNRLLWATPDGELRHYDKRHLFRYAGEHKRYAAGRERLTVEWKGWRINPQVCYDLRFPVFCRNRYDVERPDGMDFDLQIFVANWPAARAHPWKTLARARAIENLCYVAAVNRVGVDGNDLAYSGDSAAIDFLGQPLAEMGPEEGVRTVTLSAAELAAHRERFPAMLDADRFELRWPAAGRLWTIGHSTHPAETLIALLAAAGIEAVADVRRFPASRRLPQFNAAGLARTLAHAGIAYLPFPQLGGRRQARSDSGNLAWKEAGYRGYADYMQTDGYRHARGRLAQAARQRRTAILCAEAAWRSCHRQLIADDFKAAGWEVLHLLADGGCQPHPWSPAARIVDGRLDYGTMPPAQGRLF